MRGTKGPVEFLSPMSECEHCISRWLATSLSRFKEAMELCVTSHFCKLESVKVHYITRKLGHHTVLISKSVKNPIGYV